jgi:CheY-like chemotaxis protein
MPLQIAILGFSDFDRRALASHLRQARPRAAAFVLVSAVDDGQFVIADADEPGVIALLRNLERTADTLFIGAHAPSDAGGWIMRPIDQNQVLRELDAMAARLDNPHTAPLPLLSHPVHDTVWSNSQPVALDRPSGLETQRSPLPPQRRADDSPRPGAAPPTQRELNAVRRQTREARQTPVTEHRALLVDDSEVAQHFMARQLRAQGLETDFAFTSDHALDLLGQRPYGVVFLDLDLGPDSTVDGLTLCSQIRTRLLQQGGHPPPVVMVSGSHDPVHQVRATLAGAVAFLGKPLDLEALRRLLQRLNLVSRPALHPEHDNRWPARPG